MLYQIPKARGTQRPISAVPANVLAPLETVQRMIAQSGTRVVAFVSPHASPATGTICELLCRHMAASDVATILIDATDGGAASPGAGRMSATSPLATAWVPGEPLPASLIDEDVAGGGYASMRLLPTQESRAAFNNVNRVKYAFETDFAQYTNIILHLPPLLAPSDRVVNPVSLAQAANSVFLVCATDHTMATQARRAADLLKGAAAPLSGTILDSTQAQSPGSELADIVGKTWLLPRKLRHHFAGILRKTPLLNR